MALNYSHRPIFPAHIAEDNLVSPLRIVNGYLVEGVPERSYESFARPQHGRREIEEFIDRARDGIDGCNSRESGSEDIVDLLPSDPFGMDISTTFTAITGWLEDLEVDYRGCGTKNNNIGVGNEDYGLFAGFSILWKSAMRLQSIPGNAQTNWNMKTAGKIDQYSEARDVGHASAQSSCEPTNLEGNIKNVGAITRSLEIEEESEDSVWSSVYDDGSPHEALYYALGYLGVKDLLLAERVCRSLCHAVRNDPLLWRSIHIEQPLNEKITDDVLFELTSRAQGNLECLTLVECPRITDGGLRRVLESNPRLNKLCVPGCTRLNIEGIVNILKSFNLHNGCLGIKYLRIGGLYGVTHEHVEDLKILLGVDKKVQENIYKPHFYLRGKFYVLCDDDRALDVEVCPICQKLRLIYDCPSEGCQVKDQNAQLCRACALCIPRCAQCGRCINDGEYEETFCLDNVCSDCFQNLSKDHDKHDRKLGSNTS
ncbi:F-box protein SKIP14-like [Coffea arabica]|uniref:F-box protein SKIP14-like n=1 Tax=Coffea arabica TaxID=13443 RepID=A0ABM4W4I5_COFAR